MADQQDSEVLVRDEPDEDRFAVVVDGTVAGFVAYEQKGEALALLHTEVDSAYEGQGLGSKLVGGTLNQLRDRGTSVLPYCSFVRSYLKRHEDLQSVVPEAERARFGLS